jgi:hypothetical protein
MPAGRAGQLSWFPGELTLADFARQRPPGAYLDSLQRLLGFDFDPLQAECSGCRSSTTAVMSNLASANRLFVRR